MTFYNCRIRDIKRSKGNYKFRNCKLVKYNLIPSVHALNRVPRLKNLIYDFKVVNIRQENIPMRIFKGKVILIVNIGKKSKYVE